MGTQSRLVKNIWYDNSNLCGYPDNIYINLKPHKKPDGLDKDTFSFV